MPAAATDLLQEVGINTATTLDAPGYTIGDTSITVLSTANMPTATGITVAIDEVDANGDQVANSYNEYVGTVASATSITNFSHQNGTNRNYTAGATTRVYLPVSAERENRIVEWGLTHADQDGTLKAGAVDVAAVLASNVVTTAKILDSNVTTAKIADDNVTAAKIDWASTGTNAGIWGEELARTTLGSAGDTITVSSIPARKYLKFIVSLLPTGGTISTDFTFNNDTGANYVRRIATNQGADTSSTGQNTLILTGAAAAHVIYGEFEVLNITAQEKALTGSSTQNGTAGAGNAVTRNEVAGKWANTAAQITRIDFTNGGTGDFAIGSEVIVLGHN